MEFSDTRTQPTRQIFRKKTLFVRLMSFSVIIQATALIIIGVFFYHQVSTEILSYHIRALESENHNVTNKLQNELKAMVSSVYAFALNNSINTSITTTMANPDTGNEIKLNSLLSDTLEDMIFQSNKFIKTALFILEGRVYYPTITSASNRVSIDRIQYLLRASDGYLTFHPKQNNPISHAGESIIPIVFNLKFGRFTAHLIFFIDYQHIHETLESITDTSGLLIVDSTGRTVFCENPSLENNLDILSQEREFSPGVFLSTAKQMTYLRTADTIPSSGWTSYLFIEKKQALKQFNVLTTILIAVFTVVFILESVLYYLLYRRLTHPLNNLVQIMSRPIDKAGSTVYRKFDYDKDDEIGVLSNTYNEMIEMIDQLVKSLNETIEDLEIKSQQVAWEQEQSRNAEIKALQAQINPHFLYNTLNSISWLAIEQHADSAAKLAKDLASYYDISLSKGLSSIPLSKEIEHLERYLEIQSTRYHDILSYSISIPEEFMDVSIPKITLQPLAENALYHGLRPLKKRGIIQIQALSSDADDLIISVRNDGVMMGSDQLERINATLASGLFDMDSGYGIYNVNSRLKLMFGAMYGLVYYEADGLTCVDVRIPR